MVETKLMRVTARQAALDSPTWPAISKALLRAGACGAGQPFFEHLQNGRSAFLRTNNPSRALRLGAQTTWAHRLNL